MNVDELIAELFSRAREPDGPSLREAWQMARMTYLAWAQHEHDRIEASAVRYEIVAIEPDQEAADAGQANRMIRGIRLTVGEVVVCPRCGATTWRLGGWPGHEVWFCSHGPVPYFEAIADIVSLPKRYAECPELLAEAWPVYEVPV